MRNGIFLHNTIDLQLIGVNKCPGLAHPKRNSAHCLSFLETEIRLLYAASAFFTNSLTTRPSALRPAAWSFAWTALMTWPISLGVGF